MQVRQLAEAKQAELNAKILQLESHIHWLQRDNQRLQQEPKQAEDIRTSSAATPAQAAAAASEIMVKMCLSKQARRFQHLSSCHGRANPQA
jgi:peptidoglycan hydrolase CwlO-like protein